MKTKPANPSSAMPETKAPARPDFEELEKLNDKATPGKWTEDRKAEEIESGRAVYKSRICAPSYDIAYSLSRPARTRLEQDRYSPDHSFDAAFICAVRNAFPSIVAWEKHQATQINILKEALDTTLSEGEPERPDYASIINRVDNVENSLDGPLCWESVGEKDYAVHMGPAYQVNNDDPEPQPGQIERRPWSDEADDYVEKYEFFEFVACNESQNGGSLFDLFCKAPTDLRGLVSRALWLEAEVNRLQADLRAAIKAYRDQTITQDDKMDMYIREIEARLPKEKESVT